jgi:hypothetical protein
MKQTLAAIGWLMLASASFASDGQHTGVGGNPIIPPPKPISLGPPPLLPQMLTIPCLLLLQPECLGEKVPENGKASQTEGKGSREEKSGTGQPLAQ